MRFLSASQKMPHHTHLPLLQRAHRPRDGALLLRLLLGLGQGKVRVIWTAWATTSSMLPLRTSTWPVATSTSHLRTSMPYPGMGAPSGTCVVLEKKKGVGCQPAEQDYQK